MKKEKFFLFWRGPLSQWEPSKFVVDGVVYNCAEQYMMAEKARLFGDDKMLSKIMGTKSPKKQKAFGRQVSNFDKKKWDKHARNIVFRGNMAKFSQNEDLKQYLLDTGTKTLVEASPVDTVWGIGLAEDDPDAKKRHKWKGKNWLGETLTKVREKIKENHANKTT